MNPFCFCQNDWVVNSLDVYTLNEKCKWDLIWSCNSFIIESNMKPNVNETKHSSPYYHMQNQWQSCSWSISMSWSYQIYPKSPLRLVDIIIKWLYTCIVTNNIYPSIITFQLIKYTWNITNSQQITHQTTSICYNYSGDPNVCRGGWNLPLSDAGNAVYIQTYTGTNIRIKNAQPSHTVVFLALSLSVTFFFLLSWHNFLLDLNSRCYVIHILAVASLWNPLILLSYIM